MTKLTILTLALTALPAFQQALATPDAGSVVDCSEAYGGQSATCEQVACDERYLSFIGKWEGDFASYVREKSTDEKNVYRPFHNVVTYSESDCLKNKDTGDTFILGRRTDQYPVFEDLPAATKTGLLITDKKADGSSFLRTVDDEGVNDYTLVYKNAAANLSIWDLHIPASGNDPEMTFTTVDGQDFSVTNVHKRNVTVTMKVGPANAPYWQGVLAYGSHSNDSPCVYTVLSPDVSLQPTIKTVRTPPRSILCIACLL
jgi:hypothetical protein